MLTVVSDNSSDWTKKANAMRLFPVPVLLQAKVSPLAPRSEEEGQQGSSAGKVLAAKADDLSLISRTHAVEAANSLPRVIL